VATYLTPGVYLEETPGGPRPIEAVGTSTAAFVGLAPDAAARTGEAVAVNNWTQFASTFLGSGTSTHLSSAVHGFFLNGGRRCYVVNTGGTVPLVGANRSGALDALSSIDEISIVAVPGATDADTYDALLTYCELLRYRVAVLDAPPSVGDMSQLTVQTAPPSGSKGKKSDAGSGGADATAPTGARPRRSDGGYGAVYFPWLRVRDVVTGELVDVPPSGHVAGIWARTDGTRGVHKAPANETVRGALDLSYRLTDEEQGVLNPAGVNAIRFFSTDGIKVWGARTLADSASEWRYLNVRRLLNMIEESIVASTRWIVFEPNDRTLWKSIRRDVSAFLTRMWRDGALFGRTPDEAFFVQCDEETNPPEVVDAGQVVTVIGVAPVKPAEFIVFRIAQYQGGAEPEAGAVTRG
jgi:phage tail sheath protein FI